jgi:sulfur-carrier protein adenylyltransferase/sulfurtransferase
VLGIGEPLVGRLLLVDALRGAFRTVGIARDPACPACGTREIRELGDYDALCGTPAGGAAEDEGADEGAELTPRELAERLRRGDDVDLIDVREPWEWEVARIPGARLIPLGTLASALPTLDPTREIVVHCKGGGRSSRAVQALREAGFARARNLAGGIARWSDEVDAGVRKY